MSTEARHAPVPPPPATPPGATVPEPVRQGTARGSRAPAQAADTGLDHPGTAPRVGTPPDDEPDDETSLFTPPGSRPHTGHPGSATGAPQSYGAAFRRSAVSGLAEPSSPPPPPASARFPDTPPAQGPGPRPARSVRRTARKTGQPEPPVGSPEEGTDRLRPVPPTALGHPLDPPPSPWSAALDPALSWSAGPAPQPTASFGEPAVPGAWTHPRARRRTAAAAVCWVLGLGLIGGAVTGDWLTGGGGDEPPVNGFATAGTLWHSVPVDQLFPPAVQGTGAGPGGADRTWTRIAVAPDSGCAHAFDPLLHKILAQVGCRRLLRATYTDATQSYVTTVGLLFTKADPAAMTALATRFRNEHLDRRSDLMPRPYAAKGTAAAGFGDDQRASWTISVLTDAPVVAYAVSGWADGRSVDSPQPAADAISSGATTAPAQAGLGNEAQGLADRIERRLRQTAGSATETPS
ncbi:MULTISPECIES: hypothetical protein [Streptomyces]|uniref:hypothetical protein n=1 Tax=Streptomyces TaxID=1883 RepID=UPI000B2B5958|nr:MULTISPECIES: hypothetical protein [Streptomyces]